MAGGGRPPTREVDVNIVLTPYPVRVAGGTDKQALRLGREGSGFPEFQLALSVYEGSDVEVRILTGMQAESELGWIELGNFLVSKAGDSRSQVFYDPLRFLRWEVTAWEPCSRKPPYSAHEERARHGAGYLPANGREWIREHLDERVWCARGSERVECHPAVVRVSLASGED